MSGPQLRPMTMADIPAVLELEHALFGEEAWSRQMLAGELSQQPASRHYLVAGDAGDTRDTGDAGGAAVIAGYGGLLAAGGQADVLTLAVAADHWGQGIGSTILTALLAEAVGRGCTKVFLEVRIDNLRAQRLYRRFGFAQIGIRKGYYQPSGADAIVMRCDLPVGGTGGAAAGEAGGAAAREAGGSAAGEAASRAQRGARHRGQDAAP